MSSAARAPALPRVLGLFDLGVLAAAAMGPAYSLAVTLGPMIAAAGTLTPLALVLLAALMLCVALTFSRMSTLLPSAGSSFTWIGAAFGPRAGAYAAWLLLLSNFFATMTTALPAASYTLDLVAPALAGSPAWNAAIGCVWILASAALLSLGLRPTALTTTLFLLAEVVVIGATAVAALAVHAPPEPQALTAVSLPNPVAGVVTAMVLGIWMIDGWEVSASASEESAGAADVAGRGGVGGLLLTTAVLLVAIFAYLHVGSVGGFSAHQTDAMSYVAQRIGGGAWGPIVVATVLVSTAATLWTTMLYLSRSVYAMGRDAVLPRFLGGLNVRGTPGPALAAVTVAVVLCTLVTGWWPSAASALTLVLNGTSVFLGLLFCLSSLAALRIVPRLVGLPLVGAVGLAAILVVNVVQSDLPTRAVEIGGLILGIPFALVRAGTPPERGDAQ